MKIQILMLLIFFYTSGYSQDIFEYEKKNIDIEKDDFNIEVSQFINLKSA